MIPLNKLKENLPICSSTYIQINPGDQKKRRKKINIERQLRAYNVVYVGSSLGFGAGLMFWEGVFIR